MIDFLDYDGPRRRDRSLEFLSKRMSWLTWHLERAHWMRMPPGTHHMFMEKSTCYLFPRFSIDSSMEDAIEIDRKHDKKVRRLVRMAKLFNRYQDQHCSITGLIIN